jgi:hypothetical protein
MRLGKVWYDIFRYIFRFSLKKTMWEVGRRPGSGSNHFMLEDTATAKSSGLNERLQEIQSRNSYSQEICHDVDYVLMTEPFSQFEFR